jgi:guanine deaminase
MDIMKLGIEEARKTMNEGFGGPFGAVIVDSNNNTIAVASNTVLKDNDPTAHAEINAIRKACKKLNTHDLTGYKIYATGYPCPMCLSAIIWSNIKEVYYGTNLNDAEKIGFRDQKIYDFINKKDLTLLDIEQIKHDECLKLFLEYDNKIY